MTDPKEDPKQPDGDDDSSNRFGWQDGDVEIEDGEDAGEEPDDEAESTP